MDSADIKLRREASDLLQSAMRAVEAGDIVLGKQLAVHAIRILEQANEAAASHHDPHE